MKKRYQSQNNITSSGLKHCEGSVLPGFHISLLIILALAGLSYFQVNAQDGPGGVGNPTNNVLWLRADDIGGLTHQDTLDIAWPDTSGNNNDASQFTPAYRPFYIENAINGFPAIQFDGVNDFLDDAVSYNARTVFILYRIDSLTDLRLWQFFRPGFFLFLASMILLGAGLSSVAHGHYCMLIGVSTLDLTISMALLGSLYAFREKKW